MTNQFFPIERLRHFSADSQVYRAFNHLIAARVGTLLMVPVHRVSGRCDGVVDGCPVPWEEVHAVLEYPHNHPITELDGLHCADEYVHLAEMLGLDLLACKIDRIAPMVNGEEKVLRLVHPCGVRYAVVLG